MAPPMIPVIRLSDAKLDRALAQLVTMRGGPPGVVAIVQRGSIVCGSGDSR